ncbi:MAG: YfhO family protein [Tannerella sp.]|jgi:hypothetical protein|nr:YfhO family protein [Tannerella sp.]
MQAILKEWGKHLLAIVIFIALSVIYFKPAVFEGKVLVQGDNIKAIGMGHSQMDQYARTAQPGEFSAWSDAMFGGMPYITGYGKLGPNIPGVGLLEAPLKNIGYTNLSMLLIGLICFYMLMCVMGANWWLAIGGAIAFAFATYNIVVIEAGHIVKAYVIAYMPLTLAGMFLLFKRKYLWGGVLFLLGVAFSLSNGHPQITYYLMFLCLSVYIGFIVWKIKTKEVPELIKTSLIMLAAVVLSVLPNTQKLYTDWELAQSSIRGATELTTTTAAGEKISSGLDKEYAFQWSYGKAELLTFLIPNVYGGRSGYTLDNSSNFYKALRTAGAQVGKEVQAPTYWGDKSFTQGTVYFGAIVCFLFVLGMFVIKNKMKWWLFAGAVFTTFLALGRNLDWFNDFMFHYLPMNNKFRTVEMALSITGFVFPIIAFWGLKEIVEQKVDTKVLKRGFIWSLSLTGGICLLIWLLPDLFLSFESGYDIQSGYDKQPWYSALLQDRSAMASSDALRSLIFILSGAGLIFLFIRSKNKQKIVPLVCAGIAVLTLVDLWVVDKRYLNDSNFTKETPQESYKASVADNLILKDTDPSFRVLNLNNPFQETVTSYYHHSIGGYHAVKLRRYQELIDHRLSGELNMIIQSFSGAQTLESIVSVFANTPSLNMLNTRYVIYNPEAAAIRNPYAYGNAWFVPDFKIVENADAEIAALNEINPLRTAVVDKRFADELNGFVPTVDSTATIKLDNYRPNRLTYTSVTNSEQLAVFSEIYYQPGWKATIDGQPASHFRADWTLRAMRIPAGKHLIEFEFYPDTYVVAANVTAYSSFLILLLVIGAIGYSVWQQFRSVKTEKVEG